MHTNCISPADIQLELSVVAHLSLLYKARVVVYEYRQYIQHFKLLRIAWWVEVCHTLHYNSSVCYMIG